MISMYFTVMLLPFARVVPFAWHPFAIWYGAVPRSSTWRAGFLRHGFVQAAEAPDELGVGGVVNGAGDHRDGVVGQRFPQPGQQLVGRGDAVALGAEALRVLDELRVAEPRVHVVPDLHVHLPADQAVRVVHPDEDHDRQPQ